MMTSPLTKKYSNQRTDNGEDAKPRRSDVLFRSKRRSKKARSKIQDEEDDDEGTGDEEAELTVSEMMFLKEAQELREQSRMAALSFTGGDQTPKTRDTEDAGGEADDPISLKKSFAVEKSSHIAEERMSQYIEERMATKFQDGDKEDDIKTSKEDDDFAIPERLRMGEKPLYDPGEGLPAAGVEEVALPHDVHLHNEAETKRAHKKALMKRVVSPNVTTHIPANLSTNFAKHRSDWMQGNAAHLSHEESRHPAEHSDEKQDKSVGEGKAKRRRYQTASDAAVADRFRKQWKR